MSQDPSAPRNGFVRIRPMTLDDVSVVAAIDQISFPTPWSETTYRRELSENPAAYLYVAEYLKEREKSSTIIGYVGFWFIVDEAHISTIAVVPAWRRQGIGGYILDYALGQAVSLGADLVTLEVRASNIGAIDLYKKFGFSIKGRRPGYYRDSNEDAFVMMIESLERVRKDVRESVRDR